MAQGKVKLPQHKIIPGTGFTVDAFRAGFQQASVKAYFLSHAHSDHYAGITDRWNAGLIHCSPETANLVQHILGVKPDYLRPLELRVPHSIQGVEVTLIDANHCPGAVIFLFRLPDGKRYIHCGDMRYSASYLEDPIFQGFKGADTVFLDTTYCKPKYNFPPQEISVEYIAETVVSCLQARVGTCPGTTGWGARKVESGQEKGVVQELGAKEKGNVQRFKTEAEVESAQELSSKAEEGGDLQVLGTKVEGSTAQVLLEQAEGGGGPQGLESEAGVTSSLLGGQEADHDEEHQGGQQGGNVEQDQIKTVEETEGSYDTHQQQQQQQGHASDPAPSSPSVQPPDSNAAPPPSSAPALSHPRLYLISTYVIGKEKILLQVHRRTGLRIYADDRKRGVLGCFFSPEQLENVFTGDPYESPIHITSWGFLGDSWPYFRPNFTNMEEVRQQYNAQEVVGFVPTGWMHEVSKSMRLKAEAAASGSGRMQRDSSNNHQEPKQLHQQQREGQLPPHLDQGFPVRSKGAFHIHLVPYSEHSSFNELTEFVSWLRPKLVVPTVGVDKDTPDRQAAHKMLSHFQSLVDDSSSKAKLLHGFTVRAATKQLQGQEQLQGLGSTQVPGPKRQKPNTQKPHQVQQAEVWAVDDDNEGGVEGGLSDDGPQGELRKGVDATGKDEGGHGAGRQGTESGKAYGSGSRVAEVLSVLGGTLNAEGAQRLLLSAGKDDAGTTINLFCDQQLPRLLQQQVKRGPSQHPYSQGKSSQQSKKQKQGQEAGKRKLPVPTSDRTPKKSKQQQRVGQKSIASFFSAESRSQPQPQAQLSPKVLEVDLRTPPGSPPAQGQQDAHVEPSEAQQQQHDEEPQPEPADTLDIPSPGPPSTSVLVPVAPIFQPRRHSSSQQSPQDRKGKRQLPSDTQPTPAPNPSASSSPVLHPKSQAVSLAPSIVPSAPSIVPSAPSIVPSAPSASPQHSQQHQTQSQTQQQQCQHGPLFHKEAVLLPIVQYDPVNHACFSKGQAVPYAHIAHTLAACDSTRSRLIIADALTNMFRSLLALGGAPGANTPVADDLVAALYLVTGRIAPAYEQGGEINLGGRTVSAALSAVTGVSKSKMSDMYNKLGDLGDVAQACRRSQSMLRPPPPLTLQGVLSELRRMSAQSGQGAAQRRKGSVEKLMRSCKSDAETKYLVRTLVQNLRVGANWRSVMGSLARAVVVQRDGAKTPKARLDAAATAVANAFHVCPSYEVLVKVLLEYGPEELKNRCVLVEGVPAQPMLARVAASVEETLRILGPGHILCEHKYDGRRAQIHLLLNGQVRLFSRNLEDCTSAYPDVALLIKQAAGVLVQPQQTQQQQQQQQQQQEQHKLVPLALEEGEQSNHPEHGLLTSEALRTQTALDTKLSHMPHTLAQHTQAQAHTTSATKHSLVCDAEIVGVERDAVTGKVVRLRAFQELATRARGSVDANQVTLAVCVYLFDLMLLDGVTLMEQPLHKRRELMQAALPYLREGYIQLAHGTEVTVLPDPDSAPSLASKVKAKSAKPKLEASASLSTSYQQQGSRVPHTASSSKALASPTSKQQGTPSKLPSSWQRLQSKGEAGSVMCIDVSSDEEGGDGGGQGDDPDSGEEDMQTEGGVSEDDGQGEGAVSEEEEEGGVQHGAGTNQANAPPALQQQHSVLSASTVPLPQEPVLEQVTEVEGDEAQSAGPCVVGSGAGTDPGPNPRRTSCSSIASRGTLPTPHTADTSLEGSMAAPPRALASGAEPIVTQLVMEAIDAGTEGLMLKRLDGPYEPSKRSDAWVKLKKDYIKGLQDSLDLVPIGAWYGQGRKTGWFSPFLLACYDPATEQFQSVCRVMSGFTDAFYIETTKRLGARAIPGPKSYYNTRERCDVWFEASEVWEVVGADLTLSPVHAAAQGLVPDSDRGIAMRFPRFIQVREDKAVEQATGPAQVAEMYMAQRRRPGGQGA